ncbi:prepilin-type N-terminal cleavage/methylation domain-containing protein [Massilia sp. UMI-21]|nr:prepilin-type N-terminal cleavage/methylation domain-containing protein [Massilia sp. UMI-21]
MSLRYSRDQQGLSLIELLVGLAITGLVMAPLLPMLETAHAAARITAERNDLERSANFALARIAARVRAAAPSPDLAAKPQEKWFDPYSYLVVDGNLVERNDDDHTDRVLADSVKRISLDAPAVDAGRPLVTISLDLERGQASATATATVRMGSVE